jgi:transcriptional regulator with XRE-family HTH domain
MARNVEVTDAAIGALLRERRRSAAVSQPDLGEALGVTEQMVQKYETGASPMTVVKLVAAARRLKCRTTDLIPGNQ